MVQHFSKAPLRASLETAYGTCEELLTQAGCEQTLAESWVHIALDRDMLGDYGRGISRLPSILDRIAAGMLMPHLHVQVQRLSPLSARVTSTSRNWPDQVGIKASELACTIASEHGAGFVAFPKPDIAGAVLQPVIDTELLGMVFVQNAPLLNYQLSSENLVGNNPLAFCAPGNPPFLFDGALSQYGLTNLLYKAHESEHLPQGAILNKEGQEVAEREILFALSQKQRGAGSLAPLGGMKGFGIAMGLEFLAGALTGGFFDPPAGKYWGEGALVIVLSPHLFQNTQMIQRIQSYLAQFQSYPGQHASNVRQETISRGWMMYPASIIEQVNDIAARKHITRRIQII
jgi:LDH2 family malate/lactate/ureidoglycolate dehydrogenase